MSGPRTTEVIAPSWGIRRCTTCKCRLSRYNDDSVCSGCNRSRTAGQPARLSVPAQVWAHQDVKDALLQRDFGRLCQLVRERGHLRQEDMALLTGLSQPFLSMLESGRRRLTNIDRIIVLLDGLDVPADLTGPMLLPSRVAPALPLQAVS
ncbi:helix-turn-helix domain-containing protein [Streptomyces albiflavescens]|uniref:helix-turn-helix domain-containing protein n=1 Tax=Streptomyces albiflavescens TaxID=1623582 RepID=UPI00227A6CE5|nr:helix-turn-helix transcriptional regulator [Streptomyces albiflavescens]